MEEIRNIVQMILNGLQKMEYVNLTLMLDGARFSTRQDYRHFSLELGRTSTVLWLDLMMAGIQYNVSSVCLWLTEICLAFTGGHVHTEPQHEPDKIWWQTSVQSAGEFIFALPSIIITNFLFQFSVPRPHTGVCNRLIAAFKHIPCVLPSRSGSHNSHLIRLPTFQIFHRKYGGIGALERIKASPSLWYGRSYPTQESLIPPETGPQAESQLPSVCNEPPTETFPGPADPGLQQLSVATGAEAEAESVTQYGLPLNRRQGRKRVYPSLLMPAASTSESHVLPNQGDTHVPQCDRHRMIRKDREEMSTSSRPTVPLEAGPSSTMEPVSAHDDEDPYIYGSNYLVINEDGQAAGEENAGANSGSPIAEDIHGSNSSLSAIAGDFVEIETKVFHSVFQDVVQNVEDITQVDSKVGIKCHNETC